MPPRQLPLPVPNTWGGKRAGAGRKRVSPRENVVHRVRPAHLARFPMHVTMRRADNLPSLRNPKLFPVLRDSLRRAQRGVFRILHFSVQRDHVHLIVEAHDRLALARGGQGLAIRAAKAVNRALRRRSGTVWGDRYHARELRTPREVRNAIAYVLLNSVKHGRLTDGRHDRCSSAAWFDGWILKGQISRWPQLPVPVVAARSWLAAIGWRRLGLLRSTIGAG